MHSNSNKRLPLCIMCIDTLFLKQMSIWNVFASLTDNDQANQTDDEHTNQKDNCQINGMVDGQIIFGNHNLLKKFVPILTSRILIPESILMK